MNVTDRHPGMIVFIDGNTGRIVAQNHATNVPESIRFANTPRGKVPVVKVVATTSGNRREIREYGPDDEIVRSTLQLREE